MCFLCGIYEINNFAFYTCLTFYIVGASPAPYSSPGCFKFLTIHIHIHMSLSCVFLNLSPGMSCPAPVWMVCLCVECIYVTMRHLSSLCLSPPFWGVNPFSLDQLISVNIYFHHFCQEYPLTVSLERGHENFLRP